ncbi:MAG TPA: four helix bundle protein [Candidatus Hydrogenedentes bacterium]|nr:four helix bundle protein [Candidatus Hydrogenedentota bacterium]
MNKAKGPLLPHGGYRSLKSYKVAKAVYDATVVFCRRFLAGDRRMVEQMVQAARSGVRNISEGSGAAATSRKTEMKLTNVARASLADELLPDYESFLVQQGLRIWPKESREAQRMRERLAKDQVGDLPADSDAIVRLTGLAGLADFISKADPEIAANAMICAIHQAVYLLNRQLRSQSETFMSSGGFSENLYHSRQRIRTENCIAPQCPVCGKPMHQRMAKKGPRKGESFWGCSAYPACTGTRPMDSENRR